jgi:hypothetical protein
MITNYPINPRIRVLGKARLDFAGHTRDPLEWEKRWERPMNPFPFVWGDPWKQCVEYRVDDFPAEVGFFIDVIGFAVNTLDPNYAKFTSPQGDFFISTLPTPHFEQSTPPNALRLQFMVKDINLTTLQLQKRGISFDYTAQPLQPGSSLLISSFSTPHGILIELWGRQEPRPPTELELNATNFVIMLENGDDNGIEGDDGNGETKADDGDEFDEEDEVEELAIVGNDSDEEEELEGGKDLDEDDEDGELDEDVFDDEDEDDYDDDNFESDWDEDEDDDED